MILSEFLGAKMLNLLWITSKSKLVFLMWLLMLKMLISYWKDLKFKIKYDRSTFSLKIHQRKLNSKWPKLNQSRKNSGGFTKEKTLKNLWILLKLTCKMPQGSKKYRMDKLIQRKKLNLICQLSSNWTVKTNPK